MFWRPTGLGRPPRFSDQATMRAVLAAQVFSGESPLQIAESISPHGSHPYIEEKVNELQEILQYTLMNWEPRAYSPEAEYLICDALQRAVALLEKVWQQERFPIKAVKTT